MGTLGGRRLPGCPRLRRSFRLPYRRAVRLVGDCSLGGSSVDRVALGGAGEARPSVAAVLVGLAGCRGLLDKGWRVGITSNPAVATAEFDYLMWAVRDALDSFAEVPDEEHSAGVPNGDSNAGRPEGYTSGPTSGSGCTSSSRQTTALWC